MNTLLITMFIVIIVIGVGLLIVISLTRRSGNILNQARYRSEWLKITQGMNDDPQTWQFAIIRADKLLDQAMKERGLGAGTMGDRLKNANAHLSNIDRVWAMHKIRNRIAHEHSVKISKRQAGEALKVFKKALTDLGAL